MLEEEEWEFMYEMINILGPFHEATQILGGNTYVTISLIYPLINALKEQNRAASILTQEEPNLELSEDAFDDNIEYDDDDENIENTENNTNKNIKKIKINQPQETFGLANIIKKYLYKYLCHYFENPNPEDLIICILDPRIKKLSFTTKFKQEGTIELLKEEYSEFSSILEPILTSNNTDQKLNLKSKKIYKPSLISSIFSNKPSSNLNEVSIIKNN
jgi:hypothetical protein